MSQVPVVKTKLAVPECYESNLICVTTEFWIKLWVRLSGRRFNVQGKPYDATTLSN